MANISISDLFPSEIESLLDTENKEGGLIKTSVNRALEVRGALGSSKQIADRTIVGRIVQPPLTVGLIAQNPTDISSATYKA